MMFSTTVVKAAVASGLLAALVVSPVAYAKENKGHTAELRAKIELRKQEREQERDEKRDEKSEVKEEMRSHVTISASGKVHLIGAKVTAVSGSVITATTQFASTSIAWTINTASTTKIGGKATTTAQIIVGDTINVGGTIGTSLTSINAKGIREVTR